MAVKASSPWWLLLLLLLGLLSLFMGEHGLSHLSFSLLLSLGGLACIGASIILRIWVLAKSQDGQRSIEWMALLCSLGIALALLVYLLAKPAGITWFGLSSTNMMQGWSGLMQVLWPILLLISLLPLLLIEISQGFGDRFWFQFSFPDIDKSLEPMRMAESASAGLSIALAAACLMVTYHIVEEHNVRADLSYFKTSSPGSATLAMLNSLDEPLDVLLFFPENNEVAQELSGYMRVLQKNAPQLRFAFKDRLVDAALAREHKIAKDGAIVLLWGDTTEKIQMTTNIARARKSALREFDASFQKSLMSVIRESKVAYLMVGHGELNDSQNADGGAALAPLSKASVLRKILGRLNYKSRDFRGFGRSVPKDCSLLLVLAPRVMLLESEIRAIDDYLAGGGAALISFDPDTEMQLGLLKKRLGASFNPTAVIDDKEFMIQNRMASDHILLLTNQFSSHESISTMSRGKAGSALLFMKPGSFDSHDFDEEFSGSKRVDIIRSMPSAFQDKVGNDAKANLEFDTESETRARYSLAVAITRGLISGQDKSKVSEKKEMRVILLADREILSDGILARIAVAQTMLVDMIKWLGGEERFSGSIESEKDVRIEHTKSQDASWFYGMILGAPALVFILGLFFSFRRRERRPKKSRQKR